MLKNKINVLFICPYPIGHSPSQRFRFEQYFDLLQTNAFSFDVHPFLSLSTWQVLYQPGNFMWKIAGVLGGFIKRLLLLPSLMQYDFIFIHREATPVGPPWFEWLVAKIFQKKIIYDFDDAIWLANTSQENNLASKLKWHNKVESICQWSYTVSCGNDYLCNYAKQFNKHVVLNPTTIDTSKLHNDVFHSKKIKSAQFTIGWTGTHSTLKYLNSVIPVIQSLERKFPKQLKFVVIADKQPSLQLSSLHFVQWSKESEIQDLLQFDIGLMPLTDDVWAKGKCGFKALQYMALGIPSLASPVGVNATIIDDGVNGFLCSTQAQWEENIEILLKNETLRKQIGEMGRAKVLLHYSVESNSSNFLSLFESSKIKIKATRKNGSNGIL